MSRILLTGKNGQIGWELQRTLATLGEVIALERGSMDLAKPDVVRRTIRDIKPDLIVNAAAYTRVDKAELEPDVAMAINGAAPGILAEEAKHLNALLIHYSTDYVFDGTKQEPYIEEDEPKPLNMYGKTKLAGEKAIRQVGGRYLIFRTSWVYGTRGDNFLLAILRLAAQKDELRIVNDQIGAPTWSQTIAEATRQVLAKFPLAPGKVWVEGVTGVYNLTSSGETSWFEFAKAILNHQALITDRSSPRLVPVPSDEYRQIAVRPKNSRLNNEQLRRVFGLMLPTWDNGLTNCLEEIGRASTGDIQFTCARRSSASGAIAPSLVR